MTEVHLVVPLDHGYRIHCGASTLEAAVPLSLQSRVTCPGCQQWPQPARVERACQALHPVPQPAWSPLARWEQDVARMNTTEARYAGEVLGPALHAGTILEWGYEVLTLRLATRVTYTPDFVVWEPHGALNLVEVKGARVKQGTVTGYWQGDAAVKFRLARAQWRSGTVRAFCPRPRRLGGGWEELFPEVHVAPWRGS